MYSAALRRIVTFGALWLSSRSGTCALSTWKLYLRSFRLFLSRMLCEARLCSSSDSVPSPKLEQVELVLCILFGWYFRFLGEGGVGEDCLEHGAERE